MPRAATLRSELFLLLAIACTCTLSVELWGAVGGGSYSYPWGQPIASTGTSFYDDPGNTILNDGIKAGAPFSSTNVILGYTGEQMLSPFASPPVMDLGAAACVTSIEISYVAYSTWGKCAPSSVTFQGSLANTGGCVGTFCDPWEATATLDNGFNTANGGYTASVPTPGWPPIRYVVLSRATPESANCDTIVSELAVFGDRSTLSCTPSPAAPPPVLPPPAQPPPVLPPPAQPPPVLPDMIAAGEGWLKEETIPFGPAGGEKLLRCLVATGAEGAFHQATGCKFVDAGTESWCTGVQAELVNEVHQQAARIATANALAEEFVATIAEKDAVIAALRSELRANEAP